jgi:hypothetical protein
MVALGAVLSITAGGIAAADDFETDSNAALVGDQNGAVAVTLAPGASTTRSVGAWVEDQGRATTFPVNVTVSLPANQNTDAILSNLSTTSGSIAGYGVANELATTVTVTAPAADELACGVVNTLKGRIHFASTAADLNPNAVFVEINLSVQGPTCVSTPPANTPPVVTITGAPSGDVEGNTLGGATVSWTATATDAEDATAPAVSCAEGATPVTTATVFGLGTHEVTCSATDTGGLSDADSFAFTVVDTTAPTLGDVPANITQTATSATGNVVTYANPTATDIVDGDPVVTCTPPSGSTFLGTTTVSCTAEDDSGNVSAASTFTVSVTFDFQGFFQPIDSNARNGMKAGSTAPMKFRIGNGSTGWITSLGVVQSTSGVRSSCTAGTAEDALEEYATGGTALRYDTAGNQYIYNWQSPRQPGSCYRVTIVLTDGTSHHADFQLR